MKKVNIALVMLGLIIILFAVFCPAIIVKIHSIAWRIVIGLLGCFSLLAGIYRGRKIFCVYGEKSSLIRTRYV